MPVPALLRNRNFSLYWAGVILTEIGTRGTFAANLYHVYTLTGSTLQTGLVGAFQAVALILLSPMGGAIADRTDRRRLLQVTQGFSLAVALGLALLTLFGTIEPWMVLLSVLLTTAAETFDRPSRQAMIASLVPREEYVRAFALINPTREVAILFGPALAGLLIAGFGPAGMYLVDVATYAVLVVVLQFLPKVPSEHAEKARQVSVWRNITEGFAWLRHRPLVLQLIGLDLSCTLFSSYRAVLPALALDVLRVGPTGYGLLGAAPSAGALLGSAVLFNLVGRVRSGHLVLIATALYGLAAIGLAQSAVLVAALLCAGLLGFFDALHTSVRHATVQLEVPDELRGRVTSSYQIASRGGPALGDLNVGALAGALGPVTALSLGGLVPMVAAAAVALRGTTVRDYQVPQHQTAS